MLRASRAHSKPNWRVGPPDTSLRSLAPPAARDDALPADACTVSEGRQADGGGDETGFGGQPGGGDNSHSESGWSGGEDGAVGEAPAHTWLDTGDSSQGQQAGLPGRDGGQGRGGGFAGPAGEGGARAPGEQAPHRVGAPPAGPASTPGLPVELVSSAVRARSTVRRTARPVETWAAGGVPPGRAAQAPAQPRAAPPDGGQHPPPPDQDTRLAAGAPDGGAATVRASTGTRDVSGRTSATSPEGWSATIHRGCTLFLTLPAVSDTEPPTLSAHRLAASTRCAPGRRSRPETSGRGTLPERTWRHASTCRRSRRARRSASG